MGGATHGPIAPEQLVRIPSVLHSSVNPVPSPKLIGWEDSSSTWQEDLGMQNRQQDESWNL